MNTEEYLNHINSDWDYLIILDACRYDYFKYFYNIFLKGKLKKLYSTGSCTTEWFENTFNKYHDKTIYISSNPYINSINNYTGYDLKKRSYIVNAKKYFEKIIDIWNIGWDENLGTVHPNSLNYYAEAYIKKFPNKKMIIHYLQPHTPYLNKKYFSGGYQKPKELGSRMLYTKGEYINYFFKIPTYILDKFNIGNLPILQLREKMNLPPASPIDATRRKVGLVGLRHAYIENLLLVLKSISNLIKKIPDAYDKNIIVTSDHGEFLGENYRLGHPCKNRDEIVKAIPWLSIKT